MDKDTKTNTEPADAQQQDEAHETQEQSRAPYGKEEHMNEELAKQRERERQPS